MDLELRLFLIPAVFKVEKELSVSACNKRVVSEQIESIKSSITSKVQ